VVLKAETIDLGVMGAENVVLIGGLTHWLSIFRAKR